MDVGLDGPDLVAPLDPLEPYRKCAFLTITRSILYDLVDTKCHRAEDDNPIKRHIGFLLQGKVLRRLTARLCDPIVVAAIGRLSVNAGTSPAARHFSGTDMLLASSELCVLWLVCAPFL